jgi:hypothetical protein
MLKFCLVVMLAVTGLAGCVSSTSDTQLPNGPAYMQRNVVSPARQTDFFGNSFQR